VYTKYEKIKIEDSPAGKEWNVHLAKNKTNYKPTGKYLDIHGRLETPHPNLI